MGHSSAVTVAVGHDTCGVRRDRGGGRTARRFRSGQNAGARSTLRAGRPARVLYLALPRSDADCTAGEILFWAGDKIRNLRGRQHTYGTRPIGQRGAGQMREEDVARRAEGGRAQTDRCGLGREKEWRRLGIWKSLADDSRCTLTRACDGMWCAEGGRIRGKQTLARTRNIEHTQDIGESLQ